MIESFAIGDSGFLDVSFFLNETLSCGTFDTKLL